ncbi:hypothetical protein B0H16DRAFT_1745776 [Mycena metata]|uniref:Uncharacterized protein n=1 Tax=Mycena metata TaxID=1033252 RepID=A0AAD7MC51_9AGAR|nr:hypothetical protein B0H16DRAFT_1745776 [Mycena metata]
MKGKERAQSTPRSLSSSPSPPTPPPNPFRDENGHSYEDRRALAAAQNKVLADKLRASFAEKHPDLVKPAKPVAEKRKRATPGKKVAGGGACASRPVWLA